jgi:RimJ/RimL family protein N-acetyltransferase
VRIANVQVVEYRRFVATEAHELADWLAAEVWPFHAAPRVHPDTVLRGVADGSYDGPAARTFWIIADDARVGIVRLFDLDDGPMFDLRIRAADRGRGFGAHAVEWLTAYLFTEFPQFNRIEGHTRHDNIGMRRVFRRNGYVKEAHHRQAWPAEDGLVDSVGYAILLGDWLSGTATRPAFDDDPR